ncbi:TPA: DNA repair protein [Serratia marcescens]|nr:DNA repair protein [Serratia marcescens]
MPGSALAVEQTMEERLRAQLRSTNQQLQAMQSGQAQLQASRNAAEAQLKAVQAQVKQLQTELEHAQNQGKALAQQQDSVRNQASEQIAASRQQAGQYKQAYDELLALARGKEAERVNLQTHFQQQQAALASCTVKNQKLYALGKEVLAEYESLGTGSLLKMRQPFATSSRVKFDEIAQSYGDRLYENRADARQTMQQP